MINNIFLISMSNILLLWLLMYLLIIFFSHNKKKNKYASKEELKESRILARIYLDQFYITNKFYTFFMVFIYIFGMVIIFVLLRYAYIDNIVHLLPTDNLYLSLLQVMAAYAIIFITIILYRSLLVILFRKEVNKLYIYIEDLMWSYNIRDILNFKLGDYVFGPFRITLYRIATLTYKEDMYPLDMSGDINYIFNEEYEHEITNKRVIAWAYKATDLASKYILIQKFFRLFAYIFRFIHKHISKINKPFPYFLLVSIFLIDLYNKEFNNIYIVSFLFLLIKTKRDLNTFIENRDSSIDHKLSKYFYKNKINYSKQRLYFYSNDKLSIENSAYSQENYSLYTNLDDTIDYAFNNFINKFQLDYNKEDKQEIRRETGMYRRFWILIGFAALGYFLLNNDSLDNIPIYLLFPGFIMIYSHCRTYYELVPEEEVSYEENYKYSRTYNIIFWVFTIIQGYIYWILLLKPQIMFMNTEVLIELPYDILRIIRVYTIEEKVMYLYQYFEYYITNKNIDNNYLRYIIRQIDYINLIDKEVTLKDIQVYVKLLIDNYCFNEIFQQMAKEKIIEMYIPSNPWYILLRNILFIGAIISSLLHTNDLYLIIKQINTPEDAVHIIRNIYMKSIFNKVTWPQITKMFQEILEKLK